MLLRSIPEWLADVGWGRKRLLVLACSGHLGNSFVFGAFRVYGCFARGLSMTGVRPYSAAPLASSSADCCEKVPPEPVT